MPKTNTRNTPTKNTPDKPDSNLISRFKAGFQKMTRSGDPSDPAATNPLETYSDETSKQLARDIRKRYRSGEHEFSEIADEAGKHRRSLDKLDRALGDVQRELERVEELSLEGDDPLGEFRRLRTEVKGLNEMFARLTGPEEENTIFWYDAPSLASRQPVRHR